MLMTATAPFAALDINDHFLFCNDRTVFVKVTQTHYRKASAGPHAVCFPIANHADREMVRVIPIEYPGMGGL